MMLLTSTSGSRRARQGLLLSALLFAVLLLLGTALAADDRDLFLQDADQPYVFTLLDTSGSMHWKAGANDETTTPGDGDSPGSRLFQAKSALYEVIRDLPNGIRLGFAHFNQEDMDVSRKHWLYEPIPGQAFPWQDDLPFPTNGTPYTFGWTINSNLRGTCEEPIDFARLPRIPVLGTSGSFNTDVWVAYEGNKYRVQFESSTGQYGNPTMSITIDVDRSLGDCSGFAQFYPEQTLNLRPHYTADEEGNPFIDAAGNLLPSDHLLWNFTPFYSPISSDNVCNSVSSWAGNDTPSTGSQSPASIVRYPTFADPLARGGGNGPFARGEMLPWDWLEHPTTPTGAGFDISTRQEILFRLAPNTAVPGQFAVDASGRPIPDFRVARYFEDDPVNGSLVLRAEFRDRPPIMNNGGTPLAGSMNDLADWIEDWEPFASDPNTGDPSWQCRDKFAIVLSDGEETCGGDTAAAAARLRALGVRVFVIAFGGGLSADKVQAIADNGGTGQLSSTGSGQDCEDFEICPGPIQASNRQELVDALRKIFVAVEPRATAVASASTNPSRTADGTSIYLSSFLPISEQAFWPGSLTHFVQPIPLTLDNDGNPVPDRNETCDGKDPKVSCLAWDAGEAMLDQAIDDIPTDALDLGDFGLGAGPTQRRVRYALDAVGDAVPRLERPLIPSEDEDVLLDLVTDIQLPLPFPILELLFSSARVQEALDLVRDVLRSTYVKRSAPDPSAPSRELEWVLGDIFHSTPTLIKEPVRTRYQVLDLNDYRGFFRQHQYRRRVLLVGANDGMLHAFDAGAPVPEFDSGRLDASETVFDLGSGKEQFAYVPREMLPKLTAIEEDPDEHDFRMDGTPRVDDVFIDPVHNGVPDEGEREWRTLAVSGLREGGRSYFALDVTQPDPLREERDTFGSVVFVPDMGSSYVARCHADVAYSAADCGPVPYGTALWEFNDVDDFDNTGYADLGFTWSRPVTGRIKLAKTNGDVFDRYVAIFGGGLDPENPILIGNWLYMVDVETGKMLYKRVLDSAAPADPAVVDNSGDGYIDTIYQGTVGGKLWKVDLSTPVELDQHPDTGDDFITDPDWEPFEIFDTGGRQIFFPPSVVRFTEGRSLLAFGTGDREDLWNPAEQSVEGRFYVLLDDDFDETQSLTEDDLFAIGESLPPIDTDPIATDGGYFLELGPGEKLSGAPFTIAGVTVFGTFTPITQATTVDGRTVCDSSGFSNIFVTFTRNGNPVGEDENGQPRPRSRTVEGLVSSVFADFGSGTGGHGGSEDPNDPGSEDPLQLDPRDLGLPPDCKFVAGASVPLRVVRSDTQVETAVDFPVCIRVFNWGDSTL